MHKAIILAAGRGSRMGHLTDKQPKCMTLLAKKPLFEWQLNSLHAAGCNRIAVVAGYSHHHFDHYDVDKFINHRWYKTNMLASLLKATNWLEQYACIISYSDIFYSANIVKALINLDAPFAISYDPNWKELWEKRFEDPLSDAETFRLDAEQHLLEIGGKTDNIVNIQGQYMGLLKITPHTWAYIKNFLASCNQQQIDTMDMTSLLNQLIRKNIQIKAIPCQGIWGEIDSESDLQYFEEMLQEIQKS